MDNSSKWHHVSWAKHLGWYFTHHRSNHTARRRGCFVPDKGVLLPSCNWKALQGGCATSWFHLQYLQLNKEFVSSCVLHACKFQITQRSERTLHLNWLKAEHMYGKGRKRPLETGTTLPSCYCPHDIGCEGWISAEIRRGIQSRFRGSALGAAAEFLKHLGIADFADTGRGLNGFYPTRTSATDSSLMHLKHAAPWGLRKCAGWGGGCSWNIPGLNSDRTFSGDCGCRLLGCAQVI